MVDFITTNVVLTGSNKDIVMVLMVWAYVIFSCYVIWKVSERVRNKGE